MKRTVRFTLNSRKFGSQTTVEGVHVGDDNSCELIISVTDGNKILDLSSKTTIATMCATKPDGTVISRPCSIVDNNIVYTLEKQDTAVSGNVFYQVTVVSDDGISQSIIATAKFTVAVMKNIYIPIYRVLESEPSDWSTNYTAYYRLIDNKYVAVSDSSCPAFLKDTFYYLVNPNFNSKDDYGAFQSALVRVENLIGRASDIITILNSKINDVEAEHISNKVSTVDFQNSSESNYPSVAALYNYHNNYVAPCYEDIENLGNDKADKATTLSGYGITDAYTKAETDSALSLKISNEAGSVSTENIADKAVTNEKLANGAVTSMKIANNSVSGAAIVQNQINAGHIINGAITSDKLSDDVKTLINEKAKSDDVNLKLSEKADKSTTLFGYGITDAYTKEQSKNIFGLTISVVFDENFIPLNYTENSQILAGSFATGNKKIKTAYIAKNLRYIGGGAFANCDNLTDVYIDNPPEGITIASGSIPSTATIHYNSDFNDNKNLIAALTNLNSQVSAKYDSSNIEEGSGTLTVYTPAAVESNLVKSCTFRYQKTGNTANIFFSVVFNEGSISYLQFTGLPFIAKNESDQNRHIAATNKQNQVIVYPVGSWLTLNFNGTKTFSQDEILNGVITILIN